MVTRLPLAALACSLGSRMKITLSYYNVSAREIVRSSLEANASSRSRNGLMQVLFIRRRFRKASVIVGDECWQEGVPVG
jgi:hypothetical protein